MNHGKVILSLVEAVGECLSVYYSIVDSGILISSLIELMTVLC